MNNKVNDFLTKSRICALTTILSDGSPHSAAMHFSHISEPLTLYFSTENTSRKYEALSEGESIKASVVIGFSEEEWVTLQLDGSITTISDKNELKTVQEMHYLKHPHSEKYKDYPATVFLKFVPNWWRFTEFMPTENIITSED